MKDLLHRAEIRVRRVLATQLAPAHYYHNLRHTCRVAGAVNTLGRAARLGEEALDRLLLAAWFHDTGFVHCYEGHEAASQQLLEDFLREEGLASDFVDPRWIAVTHRTATPYDLPTRLLKDADLSNLGNRNYFTATADLRRELAAAQGQTYSDRQWHQHCVAFMEGHRYYSAAGRASYAARKALNLRALRRRRPPASPEGD